MLIFRNETPFGCSLLAKSGKGSKNVPKILLSKSITIFFDVFRGKRGGRHDDESDNAEEGQHMTEAQKEEEQLIKQTF